MRILTIDLGTSATKAALWSEDGPLAMGRATVDVEHPRPGWVEQDPETWWSSTLDACAQLPEDERAQVDAVGFSSQRDTFVPVTTAGEPVGRAIASADRRAGEMVAGLGRDFQVLTGVVPDAGTVAAKVAWIRRHEPDRLSGGQRWIMGPRDLVAFRLTGRGVTDTSVASRTGLLALDGAGLDGAELLPEVVGPTTVVGDVLAPMAASLGVRAGTPVVAGAGDRACELLGVAATTARPMVSWGSIAGVSVPVGHVPPPDPGIVVSRGALGGYVMEADLSAAGSALAWLGRLTGRRPDELAHEADDVDAGAAGLLALAWLGGARAPWWEARTGLTFAGLTPVNTPPRTWHERWWKGWRSTPPAASTARRPTRSSCRSPEAERRCRCGAGCSPASRTARSSPEPTARPHPSARPSSPDERSARSSTPTDLTL